METLRKYNKNTYLGTVNNESIYLSAPSWDCGWYWGFGYLGNNNCHYHIDGLDKTKNLHDAIVEHFGDSFIIRPSDRWVFAELFKSFYVLRETAEVLGRGGAYLTTNPCKDIIINKEEVERINNIVLPAIFDEIYKILNRNKDNKSIYDKLIEINLIGDTLKVLDFMKEYQLTPSDLIAIKSLSRDDYDNINTWWWRDYHANK